MRRALVPLLALTACAPAASDDDDATEEPTPCVYPEGAVEPMALDEVITPYRWAEGIHGDGTTAAIDLEEAYCGEGDVGWGDAEVVLLVSLPAW